MEVTARKPIQGVANIVRFNWHFYLLAAVLFCVLTICIRFVPHTLAIVLSIARFTMVAGTLLSLAVSFYIYDCSGLYTLSWLDGLGMNTAPDIVNIHSGFDETSVLLAKKYPRAHLSVCDFYDPVKHTEVSIKRARRAYPPYPGTVVISTAHIPLQPHSADHIFAILAAHEIRDHNERVLFFQALKSSLKTNGSIIVVEHLRNMPNFIAYNIGFLHFLSKQEWKNTFREAGLTIVSEMKVTPFVHTFILQ